LLVRSEQESLARQIIAEYRSGALDTPDAPA
jgi:hypothetical protein